MRHFPNRILSAGKSPVVSVDPQTSLTKMPDARMGATGKESINVRECLNKGPVGALGVIPGEMRRRIDVVRRREKK